MQFKSFSFQNWSTCSLSHRLFSWEKEKKVRNWMPFGENEEKNSIENIVFWWILCSWVSTRKDDVMKTLGREEEEKTDASETSQSIDRVEFSHCTTLKLCLLLKFEEMENAEIDVDICSLYFLHHLYIFHYQLPLH